VQHINRSAASPGVVRSTSSSSLSGVHPSSGSRSRSPIEPSSPTSAKTYPDDDWVSRLPGDALAFAKPKRRGAQQLAQNSARAHPPHRFQRQTSFAADLDVPGTAAAPKVAHVSTDHSISVCHVPPRSVIIFATSLRFTFADRPNAI